jgi:hypothetical protein
MTSSILRVFISSTWEDLFPYREAAKNVVLSQRWLPVLMPEHYGTAPEQTAVACADAVAECDLLLLIVAFRKGWVPSPAQGGDGSRSVTGFEVETARRLGIPVRALLAKKDSWPGGLWETDQAAREWVEAFRNGLNHPVEFFDAEAVVAGAREPLPVFRSKVRQALNDHRDWLWQQAARAGPAGEGPARPVGAETQLPSLQPLLERFLLPHKELVQAYRDSAPAGWDPAPADRNPASLLRGAVRSLARAPRQGGDGAFPLLRFIRLLLGQLPGEGADDLTAWLDRATRELGGDVADVLRLQEGAAAPPAAARPAPCALLVQVSPRLGNPGRYSVKAWLFGTGGPACLLAGEEDHAREDLPAVLSRLREEVSGLGLSAREVGVEFLLTRFVGRRDAGRLLATDQLLNAVFLVTQGKLPAGAEQQEVLEVLLRELGRT